MIVGPGYQFTPAVEKGQRWKDDFGEARVLAVAEGYAMMRRRRSNPFIVSVDKMQAGKQGWCLLVPQPGSRR